MKQCRWVYGRQVYMSDLSLNRNEIMFVTQDGEAFRGKWMDGNRNLEKKGQWFDFHLYLFWQR